MLSAFHQKVNLLRIYVAWIIRLVLELYCWNVILLSQVLVWIKWCFLQQISFFGPFALEYWCGLQTRAVCSFESNPRKWAMACLLHSPKLQMMPLAHEIAQAPNTNFYTSLPMVGIMDQMTLFSKENHAYYDQKLFLNIVPHSMVWIRILTLSLRAKIGLIKID